jgi:two-component sensor histidine kinase
LVAAVAGLAAGEYLFGKTPISSPAHLLSAATAACSLLIVVWVAERYRTMILQRGREREELLSKQFQLYERSQAFMVVISGPDLRLEFANPTYERLIGQHDVTGKRLSEVRPDLEPEYLDMLASVLRTGKEFVGRGMRGVGYRDGVKRTLYHDMVAQPLLAEDGSVEAVFVEGYDVTDEVEAKGRLKLVVQEVDHRANNLLAVVQSIVRLSKDDDPQRLQRNIVGRIDALARAHQLVSDARWERGDLRRLVTEELLPYTLGEPSRSSLQGPPMGLNSAEAQALAMGFHELATNAAKYGALRAPDGRISVTWRRDNGGARHIRWQEDGGPPVPAPARKGFGAKLLERTLRGVGGATRLTWRSEGLVCDFELPPEKLDELGQLPFVGLQTFQS